MQMCATALYSVTIVFWKEIAFFVELLTGIATEMLFPQCDRGRVHTAVPTTAVPTTAVPTTAVPTTVIPTPAIPTVRPN